VPAWLAEIVHKLLAKSPDERYQSASEVALLLEQWLAHLQQPTVIPPPFVAVTSPAKQPRRFWLSVPAIFVGSVVVLALLALLAASVFAPPSLLTLSDQPTAERPLESAASKTVQSPAASSPFIGLPPDELQAEIDALARLTFELEAQMPRGGQANSATLAAELQQLSQEVSSLEEELRRQSPSASTPSKSSH
jgi:serine/threonine protein kinase